MSTDYEDKEREFLEYLKADTGRDLGGWMQAISEADLAHRNEIIDWLRQQGFIFSWASWLERIHHNGGRPIYLDEAPPSLASPPRSGQGARTTPAVPPSDPEKPEPRAARPPFRPMLVYTAPLQPQEAEAPPAPPTPEPKPNPPSTAPQQNPPPAPAANPAKSPGLSVEVAALIAKAKAYAPLAGFILRNISEALPDTSVQAVGHYIVCNRPQTFAILVPGPKDIKLGLALAEAPFERNVVTARFSNLAPPPSKSITHMLVLTDARQVDSGLLDLLRAANTSVNG